MENPLVIRPLTVADHAACAELWRATAGLGDVPDLPAFTALLAANPGLSQVALAGPARVIGVILATSDGVRGGFYRLAVDETRRRTGVATALVHAATAAVAATGALRINIHVFAHNTQAQAFWAAHGYTLYDRLDCLHRSLAGPALRLRPGVPGDLAGIMEVIAAVISDLVAAGIDQWDDRYPDRARMLRDLSSGSASVAEDGAGIAGLVVLDADQDPAYAAAAWQGVHPAVMHRLMVHPRARGRGIARRLIAWCEGEALRRGFDSLRLDAFERNPASLRLYAATGYEPRGSCEFRKGRFTLFEKIIR